MPAKPPTGIQRPLRSHSVKPHIDFRSREIRQPQPGKRVSTCAMSVTRSALCSIIATAEDRPAFDVPAHAYAHRTGASEHFRRLSSFHSVRQAAIFRCRTETKNECK